MSAPNQGTAVIVVGIDPHKQSHTALAIDAVTGEVIDQLSVRATEAGHRRLVRRLLGRDEGLRVALEDVRHVSGRLERALVESQIAVVRVPPRLMGQARRAGRERGKSDPIDAAAVARAALAHPELPAARLEGPELGPHLLVAHREGLKRLAERPGAMEGTRARIAAELVAECARAGGRINLLGREIAHMAEAQAPEPVAIAGCGPLTAAKLVAEIAGIERFESSAKPARYAGVAPVPVSSGMRQRHRRDRTGNRQLNRAPHRIAITQARVHPPAKGYPARRGAEGKTEREARRCLKRHLINVLFRAMKAGEPSMSTGGQPSMAAALT